MKATKKYSTFIKLPNKHNISSLQSKQTSRFNSSRFFFGEVWQISVSSLNFFSFYQKLIHDEEQVTKNMIEQDNKGSKH